MPHGRHLTDIEISRLMNVILTAGEAVLIGSAAMRANGINRGVNDVDVYIYANKPMMKLMPIGVDVTDCDYIYGRLSIGDIRNSAYKIINGTQYQAVSLETLFITKAEAARDKDIKDLALIAPLINPESVMRRLGELSVFNDASIHAEFVETALMELQLHFGLIDSEILQYSGLNQDRLYDLNTSLHMKNKGHKR